MSIALVSIVKTVQLLYYPFCVTLRTRLFFVVKVLIDIRSIYFLHTTLKNLNYTLFGHGQVGPYRNKETR